MTLSLWVLLAFNVIAWTAYGLIRLRLVYYRRQGRRLEEECRRLEEVQSVVNKTQPKENRAYQN